MRCLPLLAVLLLAPFAAIGDEAPSADAPSGDEGFTPIFNGKDLDDWQGLNGSTDSYYVKDGMLICKAHGKEHIFTKKKFSDFILRFDFKLEPGGNNGVGIRTQVHRAPHIYGMEIQVLDDDAPKHEDIKPWQHHGSIYGVVPAKTGHTRPAGEWNTEEILCQGSHVRVTLNGTVIVDADLDKIKLPTPDGKDHPGMKYTEGHISLHAHGNGQEVYFKNLRVKELPE